MKSSTRFGIFAMAFILAIPTFLYAQTVGKVGLTPNSGHTIDAAGRPTLASDQSLVFTRDQPTSDGSTMIVAPGNGMQSYTVVYLDTRSFSSGGTLNIHIQIDPNSLTDGSFDLFPGNITIPTNGRPNGTLAGRYDIRRGTSTDLSYTFATGQVFAFGLDGNWFSPKGATGKVAFSVSVKTQSDSRDKPCNNPTLWVHFDSTASTYHHYRVVDTICLTSLKNCTVNNVFNTMVSEVTFIAPTEQTAPVTNCKVTAFGEQGVPGSIQTTVDPQNHDIVNYTLPLHLLYPGKVSRTVQLDSTKRTVVVVTEGEGVGILPVYNVEGAAKTWGPVDQRLKYAVDQLSRP